MKQYLATLAEDQPQRSSEEYLGAFMESLKLTQHENPIDRIGHAVLLAAKTALRLKVVMPELKEHEISHKLQMIARSIRLMNILNDLTPEELSMFKWSAQKRAVASLTNKKVSKHNVRDMPKSSLGKHVHKGKISHSAK